MIQLIISWNRPIYTKYLLDSLFKHTPSNELNIVVWENSSDNPFKHTNEDIHLLSLEHNYGVARAENFAIEIAQECNQDVFVMANDHYVFPHWIDPLIKNKEEFYITSTLCSSANPILLDYIKQNTDIHQEQRCKRDSTTETLDAYMDTAYGTDKEVFIKNHVSHYGPSVFYGERDDRGELEEEESELTRGRVNINAFLINKKIAHRLPKWDPDVSLAGPEDGIWVEQVRKIIPRDKWGIYMNSYIHHFGDISTNLATPQEIKHILNSKCPKLSTGDKTKLTELKNKLWTI